MSDSQIMELKNIISAKNKEIEFLKHEILRTNAQLEQLMDKVDKDIRITQKIQELLIPANLPSISGFEFSSKFQASGKSGGDYFEILNYEEKHKFGLLLSTSSGYSVSSLLLCTLLKFGNIISRTQTAQPDNILSQLQNEILPEMSQGDRASIFYAMIDRSNFKMNFSTNGNIHMYILKGLTGEILDFHSNSEEWDSTGPKSINSHTIELDVNDRVILLSPGIINTQNSDNELFFKIIHSIIKSTAKEKVHEVRNEIFFQLQQFSKSEILQDRTCIVMDVKDKVIKLHSIK